MNYAVIMAGGTGKRLWPLSRRKRPKQMLKLIDGQTLLRKCFERLTSVFDARNIIILTNADYADIVRENLPELLPGNLIAEPAVRDTASAIGLAATVLNKYDPDATMAILTADQMIEPAEVLQRALNDAMNFVNKNPEKLVTFGIKPDFASTQLGYIKCVAPRSCPNCQNQLYTVKAFKEKPDQETANEYISSGNYFWNSGMFVWKTRTILENLKDMLPESTEPLGRIKAAWDTPQQQNVLNEWFPKMPKISIDYAVMEKSQKVTAIKLDCRWLDMGAFNALADFVESDSDKNIVVAGQSQLLDCQNSIIVTEDKGHLIAAIGLSNIVVAHTPDATLVCPIDQLQKLKELLKLIEENKGENFL